ncbi:MAG: 2-dehydro-3-deoxygalactonokinase [Pseudoruegeria sp.]
MVGEAAYADWIAVDWGTSHLRVYAVDEDGSVKADAASDMGMGSLKPDQFEGALLDLIEPWLGAGAVDILACGMVGSRQGWVEAPYQTTPCTPLGNGLVSPDTTDSRLNIRVVPGVRQLSPTPDVMRGEETQIAGTLAKYSDFDGVLCLPGTHTKWVQVSAGEIVSFQTFMTGELFALLAHQSVLRHSVQSSDWNEEAFDAAVSDTISRPERLAARLFSLRAGSLIADLQAAEARARLSGALIGAELSAARPYWLGQTIILIGTPELNAYYARALSAQGVPIQSENSAEMTLAGLTATRATLKESQG